jgi:23S rRNA pseudouridine1911/1915/1917 synthase
MEEFIDPSDSSDELLEMVSFEVDPGQAPLRVDRFLANRLSKVSRSRIQAAIEAGLVLVNGKSTKASFRISGNDRVELRLPKLTESSEVVAEDISLNIVYEDDAVMVVNKPQGMVVHPAPGVRSGTLVNALAFYLRSRPKGTDNRFGLVHRIDRDTSGLLVIAKTEFAHAHLARQFFEHTITREYYALVWGEPDPPSGTIEVNVGRDLKMRQRQTAFSDGLNGKHAITHYETVEAFYYTSLVKCMLETGRTHQIRVHMKYIGHPLFNDDKYGGSRILKGTVFNKYRQFVENCFAIMPGHALHARSIGFTHPVSRQRMHFEIELPVAFQQLIDKWRAYTLSRTDAQRELN